MLVAERRRWSPVEKEKWAAAYYQESRDLCLSFESWFNGVIKTMANARKKRSIRIWKWNIRHGFYDAVKTMTQTQT